MGVLAHICSSSFYYRKVHHSMYFPATLLLGEKSAMEGKNGYAKIESYGNISRGNSQISGENSTIWPFFRWELNYKKIIAIFRWEQLLGWKGTF